MKMDFFGKSEVTNDFIGKVTNGFVVEDSMKICEATEGSEDKFFIRVNGKKYLVKDSSFNRRRKQPSLATFCEYAGSHFFKNVGIDCQNTFLGKYQDRYVVICMDIFSEYLFRPFRDLHQSSAGTDLGNKEYTYKDVLHVLTEKKQLKGSHLDNVVSEFWKRFLIDAILGNRDRHEGNWGFIKQDGEIHLAPVFDNGSSLFPDVDLTKINNKIFCKERVYRIPGSQFKMWKYGITDRPMRINFWEIIRDYSDKFFPNELKWARNINIAETIDLSTKGIPDFCRLWFRKIIYLRFESLIMMRDFDEVWDEVVNYE